MEVWSGLVWFGLECVGEEWRPLPVCVVLLSISLLALFPLLLCSSTVPEDVFYDVMLFFFPLPLL